MFNTKWNSIFSALDNWDSNWSGFKTLDNWDSNWSGFKTFESRNIDIPEWQKHLKESLKPLINQYQFESQGEFYVLNVPVPGLSKEDLNIERVNNTLRIMTKTEDKKALKFTGQIDFTFSVPSDSSIDKTTSRMNNGVLMIFVPKKKLEEHRHPNSFVNID